MPYELVQHNTVVRKQTYQKVMYRKKLFFDQIVTCDEKCACYNKTITIDGWSDKAAGNAESITTDFPIYLVGQ